MNSKKFFRYRNSQKRIYCKGGVYFVTGVTQNRFPYFKEQIFCELFKENLYFCRKLKGFELYGWFLGYDHFHILFRPNKEWSYSEVMRSLKTSVSCDINRVMTSPKASAMPASRLLEIYRGRPHFFQCQNHFRQKYPNPKFTPYPAFKWLKSFHDHIIRNDRDFKNHLKYITYNVEKHKMPTNWRFMEILKIEI